MVMLTNVPIHSHFLRRKNQRKWLYVNEDNSVSRWLQSQSLGKTFKRFSTSCSYVVQSSKGFLWGGVGRGGSFLDLQYSKQHRSSKNLKAIFMAMFQILLLLSSLTSQNSYNLWHNQLLSWLSSFQCHRSINDVLREVRLVTSERLKKGEVAKLD